MTDLPPPAGFALFQRGEFGSYRYERECTDEEAAVLEAGAAAGEAADRAREEALRDAWFEFLRSAPDADDSDAGDNAPDGSTPDGSATDEPQH